MRRIYFARRISTLIFCTMLAFGARAQPAPVSSEIRIELLPCGPTVPPQADVTDLISGKGIRSYGLDPALDKVPPCGGAQQPASVGAYPLPYPIPQLVKVRSSGGECSGALVALASTQTVMSRGVITAGHCVMNASGYFKSFKIYPGYQNGPNAEFGERSGSEVITFRGFTAGQQNAHDIAVIRLNAPIETKFSAYGLTAFKNCEPSSRSYFRPHYNPAIGGLAQQAMAEGPTGGCVDGTVIVGLPTGGGSSGSPVVDLYSRSIFAVHSAGNSQYSYEAPLTPAKICAIISFLDNEEKLVCPPGFNVN